MRSPMTSLTVLAVTLVAAGAAALIAVPLIAQVQADTSLLPGIPAAKGEQCVEPTDVMRRRHMQFILHQRDRTVHEGIRTEKHRFVNCINCHVQARADGSYPRQTDADHFCESCHRFSSVNMDCFQCHADRPVEAYGDAGDLVRHASPGETSAKVPRKAPDKVPGKAPDKR